MILIFKSFSGQCSAMEVVSMVNTEQCEHVQTADIRDYQEGCSLTPPQSHSVELKVVDIQCPPLNVPKGAYS